MIDGHEPRGDGVASSARRFMKTLSGVISDGLIPVSNRLRMALTYLRLRGTSGASPPDRRLG